MINPALIKMFENGLVTNFGLVRLGTSPTETHNIMENQHRQIKGYRELSQDEINAMNEVKEIAAKVGELFGRLEQSDNIDKRWLAIAKTDLQKGFMSATRSIAKPDFF